VSSPYVEAPPPDRRRKRGRFDSDWERRVFVGGPYRAEDERIAALVAVVTRVGFDAVATWDFDIPADLTHHHSLMLLHESRSAIFDVTAEAGQLMELERCRDYGIDPLVIHGADRGEPPSSMISTLLGRLGLETHTYHDPGTLEQLVREYLQRDRGHAT
jgi:hypothetical protein